MGVRSFKARFREAFFGVQGLELGKARFRGVAWVDFFNVSVWTTWVLFSSGPIELRSQFQITARTEGDSGVEVEVNRAADVVVTPPAFFKRTSQHCLPPPIERMMKRVGSSHRVAEDGEPPIRLAQESCPFVEPSSKPTGLGNTQRPLPCATAVQAGFCSKASQSGSGEVATCQGWDWGGECSK